MRFSPSRYRGAVGGFVTDSGVDPDKPDLATSVSLLNRAKVFEPAAWARLVDLYGPLVYRWCMRAGLQPADAADVGQEVFSAVARAIAKFRRERPGDSFRGWLYTITRNKLRDWANSPHPVPVGGSGALHHVEQLRADADEPNSVSDDERGYLIRRAVELVRGDFEPNTWSAFWRSAVDGQPADEVAAELGITRNAVYLAKARVRKRLLDEFAELVEFENSSAIPPRVQADAAER
ncbi:MAG: sigma-70 family RNA polymerase sigma factor [Planctomycetia bacterium]|nr:sigma-70 family RNA polymerase sigma factor [Planctomycetia bacterium]